MQIDSRAARARRLPRVAARRTAAEARQAASRRGRFDVALVDLGLARDAASTSSAGSRHRRRRQRSSSCRRAPRCRGAIHSYDLKAFAFVQKPFDIGQLFAAVRARARAAPHEPRQPAARVGTADDQRDRRGHRAVAGARRRAGRRAAVPHAARSTWSGGSIRLRNETDEFPREGVRREPAASAAWLDGRVPRPSDDVIAHRAARASSTTCTPACRPAAASSPVLSALSVPMLAGDRADRRAERRRRRRPDRFTARTSGCVAIIAGQIVGRRAERRLHDSCGAASRSGSARSTPSAIRSRCSTAAGGCCAATPRSPPISGGR